MVAYVVMIVTRMTEQAEFDTYSQKRAGCGRPCDDPARPSSQYETSKAGSRGAVILQFPTDEEAKTWFHRSLSGCSQARKAGAVYHGFVIEGFPERKAGLRHRVRPAFSFDKKNRL